MKQVTVVGLGLIGGSLALRLRAQGVKVVGADLPQALPAAEARGVADELVDSSARVALASALRSSDLTVLATPVSAILELLPLALEHAPLLTDCGSTKRAVVRAAGALSHEGRFVAGHPMAGLPGAGVKNADPELFVDRRWLLCGELASPSALQRVTEFVERLGAKAVRITAEEHDAAVALTSHLPQLLASALKVLAVERKAEPAAGPAFERATRVAGGAENMWGDIFASNGDEVAGALGALLELLEPLREELGAARPSNPLGAPSRKVMELLARARGR
jgi:prephenate dehydrogenase